MNYQFAQNQSSKEDILEHLLECDQSFVPPLSNRVELSEYALKLFRNAERFEAWYMNKLIALVAVYANNLADKTAFITSVSVMPDHMGKGLADKLLRTSFKQLKAKSFQKVFLEVSPFNEKALNLYKKLGFLFFKKKDENNLVFVYNLK